MVIYIVTDIGGRFIAAFQDEGDARKFVLQQPGKFNTHDIIDTTLRLAK